MYKERTFGERITGSGFSPSKYSYSALNLPLFFSAEERVCCITRQNTGIFTSRQSIGFKITFILMLLNILWFDKERSHLINIPLLVKKKKAKCHSNSEQTKKSCPYICMGHIQCRSKVHRKLYFSAMSTVETYHVPAITGNINGIFQRLEVHRLLPFVSEISKPLIMQYVLIY